MATGAELTYTTNVSALTMAQTIFGAGVTVVGASLNVANSNTSAGLYSNGQLSPGVVPSNSGVILSTGRITDFTQSNGDPNRSPSTSTDTSGTTDNNAQFNAIAGARTYDGVWLNADFIPQGEYMTIRFVFSSEEYPEYINSQYNDVVGVWVNGQHVPIQVGNGTISVNNINGNNQENLFVDNTGDQYNTEMDGFTLTMTLTMQVNPGVVNSIRIGIADTSDALYDSNLLIAADSVQTRLVAITDTVTYYATGQGTVNVLANDIKMPGSTLTLTHVNGQAVTVGSVVNLPSGQQVVVGAGGQLTLIGDGQIESKTFTYQVQDNLGNIDVGFVTLNQIPCFVAGTRIRTPQGDRPVEALTPGDLVDTLDHGPQPLRWIGRRSVPARGPMAPVAIRANTFGPHGRLVVSPQHRILVRDAMAELLFGEGDVLVAAKDLIDGRAVRQMEGGEVTYVHLLFDRHEVVFSEGLATESFLPGPQSTQQFEAETLAEIAAIFPELDPSTGTGYSPAVRRALKPHETRVLFGTTRAA
ncbi:MAG TPA: choice-of-anchor L domain-containing protein [Paracoccaceae bacterium]|nr:choice-of-anchor L domain-containing protein [Paracoccaceae bacterium]HMO70155.1 choice-of-anchor L domain-containing protein [Paracoccaceae bacterium]